MTRPDLKLVTPDEAPAPLPEIAATHVILPAAARHAFTSLEGRVGRLRRIFAGASASVIAAAEIDQLCAEIMAEAQRVRRFAK